MIRWRALLAVLLCVSCTSAAPITVRTPEDPSPSSTRAQGRSPDDARFVATLARVERAGLGWSWRPGCPVPVRDLRLITMRYWDFAGDVRTGEMIVHERWARAISEVFRKLFEARFPIEKMVRANAYPPNHRHREAANITTSFVCRRSVGTRTRWSEHAYGRAVDVNPLQNPYVARSGSFIPDPWGREYLDRSRVRPGMIRRGDLVWRAFDEIGWRWGGQFRRTKDYHHFSSNGR